MRVMMMAPNPTPKTTITPPRPPPPSPPPPPPPTIVGSESMAPQDQDQRQAPPPGPLKCPRCDSSNTKFCYYNNYSLSQPRHFCKACKRYWTHGGTLRDVPVGGGCRKNKRVGKKHRRHAQAAETSSASAATKNPNPNPPHHGVSTYSSSDQLTSLFYGANFLTAAACDVLGGQSMIPSNYQPSSGFVDASMHRSAVNFWSNNDEFSSFGSQDAAAISPTPKVDGYQPLLPYDLRQADCANSNLGLLMKDVKAEGIDNSMSMGNYNNMDAWQADYPLDQALDTADDSSYMYWNPMGGACWPDAANSSVAPLI